MATDMSIEFTEFLRNANRSQRGSFGEAIFCTTVADSGMTVTSFTTSAPTS
jgi:hypothetical protein